MSTRGAWSPSVSTGTAAPLISLRPPGYRRSRCGCVTTTITGCTVHLVVAGMDTGPILAQQSVPVLDDDVEQTLHERIKVVERGLLVDVLAKIADSGVTWAGRKASFGMTGKNGTSE